MNIFTLPQIQQAINLTRDLPALIRNQQQAFIDFSAGLITLPLPLHLNFTNPPGDCHVKAGVRVNDEQFVVKIATGFYNNINVGLPPVDGAILLFSVATGALQAILCDAGYLTLLRTALAACVAAQITPFAIQNIGIVGTGGVASLTVQLMQMLYPQASISIWGRDKTKAQLLTAQNPELEIASSITGLFNNADLIITTTASTQAIIYARDVHKQVHIIALGADEPAKQELDPQLFSIADRILVDSKTQATRFGDSFHAINAGVINPGKLEELGKVLVDNSVINSQAKIMITDLSGIAAQDIAISKYILQAM